MEPINYDITLVHYPCRHWLQLLGGLLIIVVSVGGCVYTGSYSSLPPTTKIAIISTVTIIDVVFFK